MRKNIFGAVLATLAMLSACETVEPQDSPVVEPETESSKQENVGEHLFTARIGADTKTYLEWDDMSQVYKTRWTDGDSFYLIDAASSELVYEVCKLVEGAGTSTGTFSGALESSSYVALYAESGDWVDNTLFVNLPYKQYHYSRTSQTEGNKGFVNNAYPMVAQSDTKELDFYNLSSVLKFSVAAEGLILNRIRVSSNDDEYISGTGIVSFDGECPVLVMSEGQNYVDYDVQSYIWGELDCYIVLPAQTYDKGFTIEIHTDYGWMDVTTGENITLEQSKIHEIKAPIQFVLEYDNWRIESEQGNYNMTSAGDYYYIQGCYLGGWMTFHNTKTGESLNLSAEYGMSYYPTNTYTHLDQQMGYYQVPEYGDFDVYLFPEEKVAFIKSSRVDYDEIPSLDFVYKSRFSDLWDVEDGQYVMVSGTVVARSDKGFILAMGYNQYNNVLVYNPEWIIENPWPGDIVDLYVMKTTDRGLPELCIDGNTWMYKPTSWGVWKEDDTPVNLISPEAFSAYQGGQYDRIRCAGVLVSDGGKYYVKVDGVDGRRGELFFLDHDPENYVGKVAYVSGYFFGFTSSNDMSIMVEDIGTSTGATTEDFVLGDEIQMQ